MAPKTNDKKTTTVEKKKKEKKPTTSDIPKQNQQKVEKPTKTKDSYKALFQARPKNFYNW